MQLSNLLVLVLERTELSSAKIESFHHVLPHLCVLEHLNVSYNPIGERGMVALAPSLASLTSLKVLDLTEDRIGPEGFSALCSAFHGLTALESLLLYENRHIRESVTSSAFSHLTSLTCLDLSCNKIGSVDMESLSGGLGHLHLLKKLKLGKNRICDAGIASLA